MDESNPLARSHELLWHGLPEPTRGPRPTLSLDQIVSAAIALADTDGLDALSMRRLAAELDVGTMSLYRYVPSKTELVNLMLDRVNAVSPSRAADVGSTWREVLERVAWDGREMYLRHPWLLKINWARPVLGPNMVSDLELTLTGLSELPFSDQEKMDTISVLDAFVTGSIRQEILYQDAASESGLSEADFWRLQLPFVEAAMATGRYPTMASMAEDTFDSSWEKTFEFGLRTMLDGVEQEVARRRPRS